MVDINITYHMVQTPQLKRRDCQMDIKKKKKRPPLWPALRNPL